MFLKSSTHPRAYGNFARLLGKYERDEKSVRLAEAIRRLTSFPASNLGILDRGTLRRGHSVDIAEFDASRIADRATFVEPQQYADGMVHVFVNGVPVLRGRAHRRDPGAFVKGPDYQRCR